MEGTTSPRIGCVFPGCRVRHPYFGFEGQSPIHCKKHAVPGEIGIYRGKCQDVNCRKQALFGLANQKATHCGQHAPKGTVNLKSKKCSYQNCQKQATYGLPGQKATHCKSHAPEGAVNVRGDKCSHPECCKQPYFGVPGQKATHCKGHAPEGAINVKETNKCHHLECSKRPHFGMPGQKPIHCLTHKSAGEINLGSQKCQHLGCKKEPHFGIPGQRSTHCKTHAPEGTINVRRKQCMHAGCTKEPYFGMPGHKALHCKSHATEGAINLNSKKCQHVGCDKKSCYGIPGQKMIYCAEHHKSGTISCPKRKCEICKAPAMYGLGNFPTHCEQHKDEFHINLVHRSCKTCTVLEIVDTEGNCSRCSCYLRCRLFCRKQRQIKLMLENCTTVPKFQLYDRQIDNGVCGRERPDFIWETPTHMVVLEVDEHQHKHCPHECERVRMINITGALGMPTFWIRYNPDEFKGQWAALTERIRHDQLQKMICHCIGASPENAEEFCRVVYMYFDGTKCGVMEIIHKIPML
jgi:hypothetical protein